MHPANKWLIGVVTTTLITSASTWEGTRYYAYKDLAGVPTVCQGHTGNGITFGRKYSAEECTAFLVKDLQEHSKGVLSCINQPLKENEFNSFVLFAYNVGVPSACNSRAIKLFNQGRSAEACEALAFSPSGSPAWSYVNGNKFVQGLHNRRLYEMRMCLGDDNA